jgi:hypothetical protein
VALGQVFSKNFGFPCQCTFHCFSTIIFTITRGWHNRPRVAAVPIASQPPPPKGTYCSRSLDHKYNDFESHFGYPCRLSFSLCVALCMWKRASEGSTPSPRTPIKYLKDYQLITKLRGRSPQANYTDRAKLMPTFAGKRYCVVRVTNSHGH